MRRLLPLLLSLLLLLSACTPIGSGVDTTPPGGTTDQPPLTATGTADPTDSTDARPPVETADPDIPHTDADNNGYCDDCNAYVLVLVDFYALNDLHGKLVDSDSQPGVEELTAYLAKMAAIDDHTVLLSSGDMWQGSSESNLTHGLIMTDWMNAVGFAAMTLGNHEYDWGSDRIRENADLAEFPLLAVNVYDRATGEYADYCTPSVMVERGGAKIGIIGAIGDCYSSISSEMSGDVFFKVRGELTALVKAEAEALRAAGADFIVYSIHDGYDDSRNGIVSDSALASYYDPILSEGYVDLVFEAHTHQRYVLCDDEGVYHLQSGGENRGISHAEVSINIANGQNRVTTAELISNTVYSACEEDSLVDELLEKYKEQVAQGSEILGYNEQFRDGDYLCDLVARLYCETGMEAWGETYKIVLGGGFLSVRNPYNLAAGDVRYSDLQSVFPFDNTLVLCSIKGGDLERVFYNTSNDRYYSYYTAYGDSLRDTIDPRETYYVVVDSYTSTYKPNNLTEVARYKEGVYARDLLAAYIRKGGLGSLTEVTTLTSIPAILAIGKNLRDNAVTDKSYFVRGEIISVENPTYGNLTIRDEKGNTLYIYGTYDSSGNTRYGDMQTPPRVGDTVILCGPVKRYVGGGTVQIELMHARLIEVE